MTISNNYKFSIDRWGNVEQQPMHEQAAGSVRVYERQGERLRARRNAGPVHLRNAIVAVARGLGIDPLTFAPAFGFELHNRSIAHFRRPACAGRSPRVWMAGCR